MIKNPNAASDRHFLITVSDKRGTRHFKIPKFVRHILTASGAIVVIALVISNVMILSQSDDLDQSKSEANALEDGFVKLSSKNSTLNQSLEQSSKEVDAISNVLTQMEQISGVSTSVSSDIVDRLIAISDYYADKELDLEDLNGHVNMLEESVNLGATAETESMALADRIELANLNISQQKLLHDTIPNGFPTDKTKVTSAFGKRTHPTTKQSSFHNGIDLLAASGTDVYATADGVVKQAAFNELSGKRIVLSHNLGFESRYAHLSKITVKVGDVVQKGDIIASSGNTGRSDGPHLHYEIRYLDKARNPIDFINWEFGSQEIFTQVRGIQWQSLISLLNKQVSRPTLQLSQVAPVSKEL